MKSDANKLLLLRLWAPVLILGGTVGVCGREWKCILLQSPLLLCGLFLMSLHELRVTNGTLYCRRLLAWKRIPYEEIVSAGVAWGGLIGYLKTAQFVAPWGRIFFVFDGSLFRFPANKTTSQLLEHVKSKRNSAGGIIQAAVQPVGAKRGGLKLDFMAAAVGFSLATLARFLCPELVQFHPQEGYWPGLIIQYDRVRSALAVWPWNSLLLSTLVPLVLFDSNRRRALIVALLVGALLPSLFVLGG